MYQQGLGPGNSSGAVTGTRLRVLTNWSAEEVSAAQRSLQRAAAGGKQVPGGGTSSSVGGAIERVDEYDLTKKTLLVRKWRASNAFGKKGRWEFEIGDERLSSSSGQGSTVAAGGSMAAPDLRASASNPIFLRQDTPKAFIFRVRNIPYPRDVYQLSVDEEKQMIVLRTSNRKYFKKFDIPALKRLGLAINTSALSYDYSPETKVLIMRYVKPTQVVEVDLGERKQHLNSASQKKDGDVTGDCRTQ